MYNYKSQNTLSYLFKLLHSPHQGSPLDPLGPHNTPPSRPDAAFNRSSACGNAYDILLLLS